jgi:restriction endonuclease S subunit
MQFIAWQLNQTPAQNYFRRTAEGSGQINIRKQTLADLIIGVPPIEKQHTLAKLYQASVQEHKLLMQLINNRIQQNSLIAAD